MSETEEVERSSDNGDGDDRLTYREWAAALREGTLLGQECSKCGHVTAAPKAACAQCGDREISTTKLDTEGEVHSVTTIAVPPERFEGDYQVALVDLGAGRVLARIDGGRETVEIGDRVQFTNAMEADGHPAPVFEPTEG